MKQSVSGEYFQVLSADEMLKYRYLSSKRIFQPVEDGGLRGDPLDKVDMYRDRYSIAYLRTEKILQDQEIDLIYVNALLGVKGEKNILGFIVKMHNGEYYIEDIKGAVKINLDNLVHDFLISQIRNTKDLVILLKIVWCWQTEK